MISIMGGEPTIHPNFTEICKIAQSYFEKVYLFTNGIKGDILSTFHPRSSDVIIYNFLFAEKWDSKSFENSGCKKLIDVVIDHTTDIQKLQKSLKDFIERNLCTFEIQLVINNSINIFKHRHIIAHNIRATYNYLHTNFPSVITTFQCGAPICFTHGLNLPPFQYRTICPDESILIDGNFNVRFCNIHTDKLLPLFNDNDVIIPFKILKNHLKLQNFRNQLKSLEKICANCIYYSTHCNGKCYVSQDYIEATDIINNTDLIWLQQLKI